MSLSDGPLDEVADFGVGHLLRVISRADGVTVSELRDGRIATSRNPQLAEAQPGDVLLVTDDGVQELPAATWPVGDRTGTVLWAGADDIVLKTAGPNLTFPQRHPEPYVKGQTVRFGPDGQPVAVITSEPIDELGLLRDDDFDPAQLIEQSGENPLELADFGGSSDLLQRALVLTKVALSPGRPLQIMGVNPIKGMLFSGPAGTGKTFLARCLAATSDAAFYNIGGPTIVDKWVGQSERRLRDIFAHARANGPAILFFDEVDSLYTQRGESNHEATNRLVGQFLSLLDGFELYDGVLVIATTNLPTALDDAVLRPGRLGHKLLFTLPTAHDRIQILKASSRKAKFLSGPDYVDIAARTEGWSAADLAAIWTEAGIAALTDGRTSIAQDDIVIGVETVDQYRSKHRQAR